MNTCCSRQKRCRDAGGRPDAGASGSAALACGCRSPPAGARAARLCTPSGCFAALCPLPLDLTAFPVGMCTRTVFAKAEVVLWRTAPETFRLEVARSFARYVAAMLGEIAARTAGVNPAASDADCHHHFAGWPRPGTPTVEVTNEPSEHERRLAPPGRGPDVCNRAFHRRRARRRAGHSLHCGEPRKRRTVVRGCGWLRGRYRHGRRVGPPRVC
jgi:hypothetical protein